MTRPGLGHGLWVSLVLAALGACVERRATRFPHELHLAHVACAPGRTDCISCLSCHTTNQPDSKATLPSAAPCASISPSSSASRSPTRRTG